MSNKADEPPEAIRDGTVTPIPRVEHEYARLMEIRCPSCGGVALVPMGPDHWHLATEGYIEPERGIECGCGVVITRVTLDMIPDWAVAFGIWPP